tara:strand:- start:208 stop:402 length:195 start_codon:yes stop_codon:yes gene_type:complete
MAKGKASVSSSGASMSKYDVEVEARLQALEKAVKALQSSGGGSSDSSDHDKILELEAKVQKLWN